ncbi:hypothetical protein RvY_12308 [Ramazzottius varieornatus]|uniref:Uncharacterized protein n=1 Tax=Ramazzottius varieornatus TaxID=947166 RepID=A0A1D1VN97_RAMVA|nr:hypothetical protein RvY_12308 [Ramazzottius varieornatus]
MFFFPLLTPVRFRTCTAFSILFFFTYTFFRLPKLYFSENEYSGKVFRIFGGSFIYETLLVVSFTVILWDLYLSLCDDFIIQDVGVFSSLSVPVWCPPLVY